MKKRSVCASYFRQIDNAGDARWMRSVCAVILFLILTSMDAATLYSVFALVLSESPILTAILTCGCSVSLNLIPVLIARGLHLLRYGMNGVKAVHLWALTATFVLLFSATFAVRWTTRDLMFAEDESMISINTTAADQEAGSTSDTPQAVSTTILLGVSPLITSVINLAVGYLTDDPVRLRYKKLRQINAKLHSEITQAKAAQKELQDRDVAALQQFDDNLLALSKASCSAVTDRTKGLARFLLARKLGDPESISRLSD